MTFWIAVLRPGLENDRQQGGKTGVKKTTAVGVLVLCLALAGPALAQTTPGGMGMGRGMGMGAGMGPRLYNPQTVTTISGQVEKLADLPSMGGGAGRGMQYRGVTLKTGQGSLMVHLGPGWYLDEKKFAVKVGDTVEVTGSKVTLNQQPALIAREVKANGATLQLRDDQGLPVWRGMGSGGGQGMGPAGK
jgi:hypothetical protein